MSFQAVEPELLVRDVIRELTPDSVGRNMAWHIGDLPAIVCDTAMLRLVLSNLIANALKFTRPAGRSESKSALCPAKSPKP